MSFINLMASDVWSEADIKSRLHAEIRGEISEQLEQELNRALQGKALSMHTMTDEEMALLMQFKAATDRVALLGIAARADMTFLGEVLVLEMAQRRLALAVVDAVMSEQPEPQGEEVSAVEFVPAVINQDALDTDNAERFAAQAVVDAAQADALDLYLLRNPVPEPEPELEAIPELEPEGSSNNIQQQF